VNTLKKILFFLILLTQTYLVFSQNKKEKEEEVPPLTRILFIFDASQSMYGRWQSDTKINIAQKLLSNMLDSLKDTPNLEMAFRVYGHQKNFPPQDCNDTKLEVPFAKGNSKKIEHKLKSLVPRGTTPIAFALEKAADDFPPCKEKCRNIVILITDGLEECGGDPCAVSQLLQKKGIILKPFIIGIGKNFKESFDCVGNYFDAASEMEFNKALNVVISQALNSTTAQVNLLDETGKPTETNVNMTFYDSFSGLIKYNFIHTINSRGVPDTIVIDPLINYNLVVHTIPPVTKEGIVLTPGKHSIIALDAPQGYLKIKTMGSSTFGVKNFQAIIRKKGSSETLNLHYFNQTEKYIVGSYDIEVLCLPRLIIKDVEVKQSTTTTVEIPVPGIAVINKVVDGYGSLYVIEDNKMKWIYNFNDNITIESLVLQPGTYRAVYRGKMSTKSISTIDKEFKIESGTTTSINLYRNQ
jgi:Ca-activated chloride channel family protein